MSQTIAPVGVVAGDAYADIAGTLIDTINGEKSVTYRCAATVFGATFKVVGSLDNATFVDLVTSNELGVEAAAVDVAVAVGTAKVLAIREQGVGNGSRAGFRWYKLQQKNTVGGSNATGTVTGFAK